MRELSGGEQQRAWIALALAQDTATLLLDEPTTFLDVGHQMEIMELVVRLNREQGLTIVLVLHDLNQAARYADTPPQPPASYSLPPRDAGERPYGRGVFLLDPRCCLRHTAIWQGKRLAS